MPKGPIRRTGGRPRAPQYFRLDAGTVAAAASRTRSAVLKAIRRGDLRLGDRATREADVLSIVAWVAGRLAVDHPAEAPPEEPPPPHPDSAALASLLALLPVCAGRWNGRGDGTYRAHMACFALATHAARGGRWHYCDRHLSDIDAAEARELPWAAWLRDRDRAARRKKRHDRWIRNRS